MAGEPLHAPARCLGNRRRKFRPALPFCRGGVCSGLEGRSRHHCCLRTETPLGRLPACPGLLLGARERAAASRPLPRDSPWCCRLSASGRAWELGPSFLQRAAHSVQPVPVTCDVLPPIGHTSAVGSVPLGTAACMACPARLRPHLHQACTPPLLAISWGHDVPTLAVDELELVCGSHRPVQPCRGRCGCLHEAGTSRLRSLSLTGHEE